MANIIDEFHEDGFVVVDDVLTPQQCRDLLGEIPELESAGARNLLDVLAVRKTASDLRDCQKLAALLADRVAVQCTAFLKSQAKNWAVRLHRDRAIPAAGGTGWKSAGTKDGLPFVQPDRETMMSLTAVRLNLDPATEGDLQVVPGSHLRNSKSARSEAVAVPVSAGGVLIMSPMLEHASTKLRSQLARRVLHFVFGPRELPHGYKWSYAL